MTTETILTDESIAEALVKNDIFLYEWEVTRYDINFARALEQAVLQAEKAQAWKRDAERLDWLADPNNSIGNVQLPTECVIKNLHSLRAAIDAAMEQQK